MIDASVWVSYYIAGQKHHDETAAWLDGIIRREEAAQPKRGLGHAPSYPGHLRQCRPGYFAYRRRVDGFSGRCLPCRTAIIAIDSTGVPSTR